ncbi:hypothetical protein B0H13DRAFT_2303136 [Mycena leptocephala]|nr:hypothetical protein B0H13DRAFT_2303136 [Mycena leptocephala]
MSKIIHSGEHWQMLRRRRKEREARAAAHANDHYFGDAEAHAYTFIPGQATPIVSVVRPGGKLVPIEDPAASATSLDDDEILLARLAASREKQDKQAHPPKRKTPASPADVDAPLKKTKRQ